MILFRSMPNGPRGGGAQAGYLPGFLSEEDPRPAREQIDANYQHGGGWRPYRGFTMDPQTYVLSAPDDPDLAPIAYSRLRSETLYLYPYEWLAIVQPDGSFEVSRVN